jgi:hypothetical protein
MYLIYVRRSDIFFIDEITIHADLQYFIFISMLTYIQIKPLISLFNSQNH